MQTSAGASVLWMSPKPITSHSHPVPGPLRRPPNSSWSILPPGPQAWADLYVCWAPTILHPARLIYKHLQPRLRLITCGASLRVPHPTPSSTGTSVKCSPCLSPPPTPHCWCPCRSSKPRRMPLTSGQAATGSEQKRQQTGCPGALRT